MTMGFAKRSRNHIRAGQVVRYVDGELEADERSQIERHLDRCQSCRATIERTRQGAAELGRLLSASDFPIPALTRATGRSRLHRRRSRLRPSVRTLAAVLCGVVIATMVSVGPVRAWVADRWGDLKALVVREAASVTAVAELDAGNNRASLTFTPKSREFVLGIANRQIRGQLVVEFLEDTRASAEILDGSNEDLIVLPDGLRILNGPESTASYRLTIPARYSSIVLELGSEPGVTLSVNSSETVLYIDLAPAR